MRPAQSPNPQLQATGVERSALACMHSLPTANPRARLTPQSTMTPIKIPDLAYGAQAFAASQRSLVGEDRLGSMNAVDRHVIDVDGHVGAVVEIVATQEVLVGFALATVLRDDQSGGRLQDFARARRGACIHLGSRNGDLAGQAWSEGGAATHVGRAGRELRTSIDSCARRWGLFGGFRRLGGYFLGWRRRDDDARKLLLTKRLAGPDEIPS